jgi:DNA-binding GntR family transcriptional regulator
MTATSQQPPGQQAPAPPARPPSPAAQPPSATHDPRLYIRIATDLRARLTAGTIAAGTTLPMNSLARQWRASRNTVRKALRTLENDGLIKRYPAYGYRVLPPAATTPDKERTHPGDSTPPAGSH